MMTKLFAVLLCSSDILLLLTNGQGTPADSCEKQITNCACKTAKGYINLEPIDAAKNGGMPKFNNIIDYNGNTYSYNPCSAYTTGTGACSSVAACQTQYGTDYDIGNQEQATFQSDSSHGTFIKYTAKDGQRTSRVKLLCDSTQEGSLTADGESETTVYDFTLTTKYACPDAPPPAGVGGGGLSAGSVLLIVFFVVLGVYLIAGMIFMKVRQGASGMELLPNIEFWKALPGLAKDGVLFTKDKILGLFNMSKASSAGYEKY